MGIEIERKFLVDDDSWRNEASDSGTDYRQGYLAVVPNCSVRIRLADNQAWLTIKSGEGGLTRQEFEYPVPPGDAEGLLALCEPTVISKTRYLVSCGNHRWEIDEFHDANAGLVVAEIELSSEDEAFETPGWLGKEVSDDVRYYNAYLSSRPYRLWKHEV
jgi:adenylate cyclase